MEIFNVDEAKKKIARIKEQTNLLSYFKNDCTEFEIGKVHSHLFPCTINTLDDSTLTYMWELKYATINGMVQVSAYEDQYDLKIPWTFTSHDTPEIALINLARDCYRISEHHCECRRELKVFRRE